MILCKVIGNITSTVKHKSYNGKKIMLVVPLSLEGKEKEGKSFLAIDQVQAGEGETVIVLKEGSSARLVIDDPEAPARAIIMGIVDEVKMAHRHHP